MKILLVNTYGHGGAANSCIRLHEGLLEIGVDSRLLLMKQTSAPEVRQVAQCDARLVRKQKRFSLFRPLPKGVAPEQKKKIMAIIQSQMDWFSFGDAGYDFTQHPWYAEADIVNFHWASGYLDYALLPQINKPIVWTLHDMNAFTGGCHYAGDCDGYKSNCGICPQLPADLKLCSATDLKYKKHYLQKTKNITVVSPSRWLASCSESSTLLKGRPVRVIQYGINSSVFQPRNRNEVRARLELPADKRILLFVTYKSLAIRRKGYEELLQALQEVADPNVLLLAVGGPEKKSSDRTVEFGFVGKDEEMAELFAAADLFVAPSLEDNLPNTVIESLLCGTPVVGFKTGGIPDMITTGVNGVLAEKKEAGSLADAIRSALSKLPEFDREKIARDASTRYALSMQAAQYKTLYSDLLRKAE